MKKPTTDLVTKKEKKEKLVTRRGRATEIKQNTVNSPEVRKAKKKNINLSRQLQNVYIINNLT